MTGPLSIIPASGKAVENGEVLKLDMKATLVWCIKEFV